MFGLRKLKAQIAIARVALQWYADPESWLRKKVSPDGQPLQWVKSQSAADRGDIARAALAGQEPLLRSLIARTTREQRAYRPTVPAPLSITGDGNATRLVIPELDVTEHATDTE